METAELIKLINTLTKLTQETEWVEFKHNFHSSEEIGERLSALSNSACLCNKPYGYLIFGIDDTTHKVVGTTFKAKSHKKGNEAYFDLMKLPMPTTQQAIIEKFKTEQLIAEDETGLAITELGAILFAKNLADFDNLKRKAVRVIVYKGKNKLETEREQMFSKGYALSFENMIDWIKGQLPANEEIGKVLRREVTMYPEITIREIIANMIIHQDFTELGFPMVEIYSDRMDISNPGLPLINTDRFIDEYVSRNESLADIMRRMGFCEEKGSGMDKALINSELYKLPPMRFSVSENRTTVTLFSYRPLSGINKQERLAACYQHACIKYVSGELMTNQSLRERLGVEQKNYPMISRIIKDGIDSNL